MSTYKYKPQTFFEFKKAFMDQFGNSDHWYLGQSFCTRFIPQSHGWCTDDSLLMDIWYTTDNQQAEDLIFKFIYDNNWDFLELSPVKDVY